MEEEKAEDYGKFLKNQAWMWQLSLVFPFHWSELGHLATDNCNEKCEECGLILPRKRRKWVWKRINQSWAHMPSENELSPSDLLPHSCPEALKAIIFAWI